MNTNRRIDALLGYDSPAMGDERQRDVILRANNLSFALALVLGVVASVFLAATGLGWGSLIVLFAATLPVYVGYFYGRREGVDIFVANTHAPRSRRLYSGAFATIGVIALLGSIGYQYVTGHPLFAINWGPAGPGEAFKSSEIIGTISGAICGAGAVLALGLYLRHRARKSDRYDVDED